MTATLSEAPLSQIPSIGAYASSVELLAQQKVTYLFNGEGAENSAIIMANIFKHAQTRVRIYARDMDGEISCHKIYTDSLFHFLYAQKHLEILLDNADPLIHHNRKLHRILSEFAPLGNVHLRLANDAFRNDLRQVATDGVSTYHFALGDETMLRIETDENTRAFVCSFNRAEMARPLADVFDRHFALSEPVPLENVFASPLPA